jgi:hypothetical protein
MYTLMVFDEETKLLVDFIYMEGPEIDGRNIRWRDGSIENIHLGFIVVEGEIPLNIGQDISSWMDQDEKLSLKPFNKKTSERLDQFQTMINGIMLDPQKAAQKKQIADMQKMINNLMFQNMPK